MSASVAELPPAEARGSGETSVAASLTTVVVSCADVHYRWPPCPPPRFDLTTAMTNPLSTKSGRDSMRPAAELATEHDGEWRAGCGHLHCGHHPPPCGSHRHHRSPPAGRIIQMYAVLRCVLITARAASSMLPSHHMLALLTRPCYQRFRAVCSSVRQVCRAMVTG